MSNKDFTLKKIKYGYSIEKYNGIDDVLVIPSKYKDSDILEIEYEAFANNKNIRKITFEEGMEKIGAVAFENCINLEEITFPKSLIETQWSILSGCTNLKKLIVLNPKTKFGNNWCNGLKNLEKISVSVFKDLSSKEKIRLLTEQWNDFSNDEQKKLITHLKQNKYFREQVFIYSANTVIKMILENCNKLSLEEIKKYNDFSTNHNNILAIKMLNDYKIKYFDKEQISKIEQSKPEFEFEKIDDNLTLIQYNGDDEIVTIPDSFQGEDVTSIGFRVFENTTKIEEIILPKNLKILARHAFVYCNQLKSITLPEGLLEIKRLAFICENLEEVILPKSLQIVAKSSFFRCPNLRKVVGFDNTKFSPETFEYCDALQDVSFCIIKQLKPNFHGKLINNLLQNINNLSQQDKDDILDFIITKRNLLQELFMIGDANVVNFLLQNNIKLTLEKLDEYLDNSITQKNTICTAILIEYKDKNFSKQEQNKHQEDKDLTEIGLKPPNRKQIDELEDEDVIELMKSTIENIDSYNVKDKKEFISMIKNRKSLKKLLFSEDNSDLINFLLSIRVKLSIEEIDFYMEKHKDNPNIIAQLLEYKNKNISDEELQKAKSKKEQEDLVDIGLELPTFKQLKEKFSVGKVTGGLRISGYKGSDSTVVIPDTIDDGTPIISLKKNTSYEPYFFDVIENLILGENITLIEKSTFTNCKNLKTIKLPNSIKKIDNFAFYWCTNLKEINLPESLEFLGFGVFCKCENLEEITIPNSILKLPSTYDVQGIFKGCKKLKSVKLPEIGSTEFTQIPAYAFYDCVKLEEINIPKSVKVIRNNAFSNCKNLQKIILPENLEKIEDMAFYGCEKLKEIIIPANAKISKTAFDRCKSIKIKK